MKEILILLLLVPSFIKAQHDSSYYYSYKSTITARIYFSNKSTTLNIKNIDGIYNLNYRPNTTRNIGVGATYKLLTVNFGVGFGFLNPEDGRGKTRYVDLQVHQYGRKIILDVFGQFYKGFYLNPKGYGTTDKSYYLRPDLRVNEVGASVQYVFNSSKYSYRASFLQNEWQRKSSGSVLVGLETYIGDVVADSSLFPAAISKQIASRNYHRINFFEFGPNVGYTYTFVFKKHFFATGSATLSIDAGDNVLRRSTKDENTFGISTNTLYRISTGYNSYLWAISIFYITNNIHLASHPLDKHIQFNTTNFRVNLIRRIAPSAKVKRYLNIIK